MRGGENEKRELSLPMKEGGAGNRYSWTEKCRGRVGCRARVRWRKMLYYTEMSLLTRILLAPAAAYALEERFVILGTGVRIPFTQLMGNLTAFLAVSATGVCTLLFLVGAAQITISHGDQTKVDNGKKMMISALIGLAIILSAYAIVRTVLYFLYEGTV